MEQTGIYWIRHKNHTDLMCEGYIGVTKNLKERLRHHFKNSIGGYHSDKILSKAIVKYGKENIEASLIVISNESYCYDLEKKLRPKSFIGWNMREGGYHTPNPFPKGSKMPIWLVEKIKEVKKRIANEKKQQWYAKTKETLAGKYNSYHASNKEVVINDVLYPSVKDAREAFKISSTQMKRFLNGFDTSKSRKFKGLKIKYANS